MLTLRRLSKSYVPASRCCRHQPRRRRRAASPRSSAPSGTGKSTLIRCINRLVEPTAGEILFEGADLAKLRGAALRHARRHIGMVFQEYNLVERLTVMENLLVRPARLRRRAWRAWRRKFPPEDIRPRLRAARRRRPGRVRASPRRRALRRPAPARGHRARGDAGADAAAGRRADVLARPEDVGRDHGAARRASRARAGFPC